SGQQEPSWAITHGKSGSLQPLVVARPGQTASGVGGWAHVMDSSRCTALAMGGFAKRTHDRIEADGSGRLLMYRDFRKTVDATKDKKLE
ncbi:hypothetical protein DF186_16755, partial [Enterococcus hirae]